MPGTSGASLERCQGLRGGTSGASFSLAFLIAPIAQLFLPFPIVHIMGSDYYLPFWFLPFLWLGGALNLLVLIHLARAVGRWHAKMAKAMLARPGI